MKELRVAPAELTAKASEMETTRGELTATMDTLRNEMVSLKTSWTSDAATKTQFQFEATKDDVDRMLKVVDEYVADLKELANTYKTAEEQATAAAAALPTDIFT